MKTRLYHKFMKMFMTSGKTKSVLVDKYLFCARGWHIAKGLNDCAVSPMTAMKVTALVNAFKKRYEKFSRKYWLSSAKLRRAIISGEVVKCK